MNALKYERNPNRCVQALLTPLGQCALMSLFQTDIFSVAEKRLAWTSERQAVLARNIANLSTPGFQAMDSPNFQQTLEGSTGVQPVRTDPKHLAGTIDAGMSARPVPEATATTADKNGVRLEEQLMRVADTETLHSTVTAIFKTYMTMFNTALGKAS
jgi:flagellar basal-body rod protein FlgB